MVFGKRGNNNNLSVPPVVEQNPNAVEVLSVWASPGEPQTVTLRAIWDDPGAWGLLLVDVARHAAKAYERQGHDPGEVLSRILELWEAEWSNPTDLPRDITPES